MSFLASLVLLTTPPIDIEPVAPGVWRHVSYRDLPGAPGFPSNGMIVEAEGGLVLVDTAWGEDETSALLEAIETRFDRPVLAAIVTHAHEDRIGGAPVLDAAGVPVWTTPAINAAAEDRGLPQATQIFEGESPAVLEEAGLSWTAPGAGHAVENIVLYHAPSRVLFGGCFIRAADTSSLGYVEDGDVPGWPAAVETVRAAYPDAHIVVPGHGAPGGTDLLDHTRALAEGADG